MNSIKLQICKYIITALALLTVSSCSTDTFYEDGNQTVDVPEGMALIPLHTNAKDYQTPVTRSSANEDLSSTEMPWVFVFVGSDDDAVFFEARKGIAIGVSGALHVILTRQNESVRILIVANAPETFFNGTENVDFTSENLNSVLTGKTIVEAVNNYLNSPKVTTANLGTILYDDSYLPMSEIHDELTNGIDENSSIGKPAEKVVLKRIVAKVTVTSSVPGFTLEGASVVKTRNYGRLYQLPTGGLLPPATNADLFNYITLPPDIVAPAVGNTTQATPIYIYESLKEDQTSVIIKGTLNGIQQFYRLVFKSKNEPGNPIMDISRNKLYAFTITSVDASGFSTINEAMAAAPSNDLINYSIAVVDMDSHDIIDNGTYYLGVSNSALQLYTSTAENNITAVTLSTNATQAMLGAVGNNYISVTGSGLSLSGGASMRANLSADGITPAITEIKINTTSDFSGGTINIALDKTVKSINIVKAGAELEFIDAILNPEASQALPLDFATASVDPASASWISFSLLANGSGNVGSEYEQPNHETFTPIYVKTKSNYGNGATPRAPGIVYLSRKTEGRLKLYIKQAALNTSALVYTQILDSYMGAFYRATQTDERRITIPAVGATPANIQGAWYGLVVAGQDWIKLDTEPFGSNGGNVSPLDATSIRGTASASTPIRFRIGATSAHPSGSDAGANGTATPRYGLIVVAYGTPLKAHSIYVRQGEAAAAVVGTVKWSPYNVTDPNQSATATTLPQRGGAMTSYPTQAGYFFQWNKLVAYNPTNNNNSLGGTGIFSWSITREVCPPGYVHPTENNFATSISQSSGVGTAFWPGAWGYYADGLFDRGTISNSINGEANSTVGTGATVAYKGRLFFNSATNASIFFPAAGERNSTNGTISNAGAIGYTWSQSLLGGDNTKAVMLLINPALAIANSGQDTGVYSSVRCVRQ